MAKENENLESTEETVEEVVADKDTCLLYTSPSPRDS